jgi:putative phage-type endonuclease
MFAKQGSDEWKRQRLGIVTGSRFADVMSNGKGGRPSEKAETYKCELLAELLIGEPIGFAGNSATERGNDLEASAVAEYEFKTGVSVDECGFMLHPQHPGIGCSPDGLIGSDGIVEVKCPANPAIYLKACRRNEVPTEYHHQVQGNLWVTGRAYCDFIMFDPRMPKNLRMMTKRVTADLTLFNDYERRIVQFAEQVSVIHEKLIKG